MSQGGAVRVTWAANRCAPCRIRARATSSFTLHGHEGQRREHGLARTMTRPGRPRSGRCEGSDPSTIRQLSDVPNRTGLGDVSQMRSRSSAAVVVQRTASAAIAPSMRATTSSARAVGLHRAEPRPFSTSLRTHSSWSIELAQVERDLVDWSAHLRGQACQPASSSGGTAGS